jgi:hypothetical protein
MERWKARARRWEHTAAQRRLKRRRETAGGTPGTISDNAISSDDAISAEGGDEPRTENSIDNTKVAA